MTETMEINRIESLEYELRLERARAAREEAYLQEVVETFKVELNASHEKYTQLEHECACLRAEIRRWERTHVHDITPRTCSSVGQIHEMIMDHEQRYQRPPFSLSVPANLYKAAFEECKASMEAAKPNLHIPLPGRYILYGVTIAPSPDFMLLQQLEECAEKELSVMRAR